MPEETTSADRAWRRWIVIAVVAILLTSSLLGFVVIPVVQGASSGLDAYDAICRAFGVQPGSPSRPTPPSQAQAQPTSNVAWNTRTLNDLFGGNRKAGGQLAESAGCVGCHAPDGTSPDPSIPRLSGQSAFAIYKQLHDFKSGARVNEIMTPQVQGLEDKQIADVALYYSNLYRGDLDVQRPAFVGAEVERLVVEGDSERALPPCTACHGRLAGGPIEVPTLAGQHRGYVLNQLQAFAKRERHNDIYERMRSVAAKLTDHEMALLAVYYSSTP
ncbi:MAG: cytochrome c4 [Acetobacteraceae bacterium]|nr:cytochrome c4 [Acetobacteraceae bacterium]